MPTCGRCKAIGGSVANFGASASCVRRSALPLFESTRLASCTTAMKKFIFGLVFSAPLWLVLGCGGGGGGDSGSGTKNDTNTGGGAAPVVLTGKFLDAAVGNIKYNTSTQSGMTDALGQFKYVANETVTFSVGNITLPPVTAGATITPLDLAGTTDIGNNTVLNILVFLQSLDDDGNPDNGINIPATASAAATSNLDFTANPSAFRGNSAFTSLIANSGSRTKVPVTVDAAITHFNVTLASNGISAPDPRPVARIADITPTMVGKTVLLDAAASTDPKSATLAYSWTLTAPASSKAKLSVTSGVQSSFAIDLSGTYLLTLTVDNGALKSSKTLAITGIDNIFGPANLYLYGKGVSNQQSLVYLGCITCDASQSESICNSSASSSYGLTNSASSIWDLNATYGDPSSGLSPWNPASLAGQTPIVFNTQNDLVALFSVEAGLRNAPIVDTVTGTPIVPEPRAIQFLDRLFATPTRSEVQTALCNPDGSTLTATGAIQGNVSAIR